MQHVGVIELVGIAGIFSVALFSLDMFDTSALPFFHVICYCRVNLKILTHLKLTF